MVTGWAAGTFNSTHIKTARFVPQQHQKDVDKHKRVHRGSLRLIRPEIFAQRVKSEGAGLVQPGERRIPSAYRKDIKKMELCSLQSMGAGGKISDCGQESKQGRSRQLLRKMILLLGQWSIGSSFPEVFWCLCPRDLQDKIEQNLECPALTSHLLSERRMAAQSNHTTPGISLYTAPFLPAWLVYFGVFYWEMAFYVSSNED